MKLQTGDGQDLHSFFLLLTFLFTGLRFLDSDSNDIKTILGL